MSDAHLTVATFNLRVDAGARTPAQAWTVRRPLVSASIRRCAPDILGTQEGLFSQLQDLRQDLPEYRFIGQGREGGSRGEFVAIFYRSDRFAPVAEGNFWLSDTPDVPGSSTWGNCYKRMATWAQFSDRLSQRELMVLNTHWDHEVPAARDKSAGLIRERILRWPAGLPVVVTGDFNAVADADPSYRLMMQDGFLHDTWTTAAARPGDPVLNTFHDFQPPRRESRRIDWILTRGPLRTVSVEIVNDTDGDRCPSDHFPVVARLNYG